MRWLAMAAAVAVADTVEVDGDVAEADGADTVDPIQHLWAVVAVGRYNDFPWTSTSFRHRTSAMD